MLAISWGILWNFFAMSGVMFWAILSIGGILAIVANIYRVLNDKSYQEYTSLKCAKKLNELQTLPKRIP